MPAMNRYIQRLRRVKAARHVVPDAPPSENPATATITILELSGIEYHSIQGNDTANATLDGSGLAVADSHTPAIIVVWCTQNEPKSSNSASVCLPSCPMTEESMDDEGNVLSWSCVWPDEASSLDIPFPLAIEKNKKNSISLHMGLLFPHRQDEIQPLGFATITIPEPELNVMEEFHPQQTLSLFSVPVDPLKQKPTLSSRFGRFKNLRSEYSISPSTELKLELNVTWEKSSSTNKSLEVEDIEEYPSSSRQIDQGAGSDASTTASEAPTMKSETELSRTDLSNESKTAKTVKFANITAHFDDSDALTIESVDSVLNGSLAKRKAVVIAPFGERLKTHFSDIFSDDGNPEPSCDRDLEIVVMETFSEDGKQVEDDNTDVQQKNLKPYDLALNDIPEDKPLLDVIELRQTNSDISRDLTYDDGEKHQFIKCNEVRSCAAQLEEVFDDAVEGFNDIVTCGVIMEDMLCDDVTCRTDCTSLDTYEPSLYSYQSSRCQPDSNAMDTSDLMARANLVNASRGWSNNIMSFPSAVPTKLPQRLGSIPLFNKTSEYSNSIGRPPTSRERSVWKSRHEECDQSLSVYSV